jgi:hypothetical protein
MLVSFLNQCLGDDLVCSWLDLLHSDGKWFLADGFTDRIHPFLRARAVEALSFVCMVEVFQMRRDSPRVTQCLDFTSAIGFIAQ